MIQKYWSPFTFYKESWLHIFKILLLFYSKCHSNKKATSRVGTELKSSARALSSLR